MRDLERERERERESEWVSANTQQQASNNNKKKKIPKHQNMSEWIITIPRHRGVERQEGRKEGRREGGREREGREGGGGGTVRAGAVTPFKRLSL